MRDSLFALKAFHEKKKAALDIELSSRETGKKKPAPSISAHSNPAVAVVESTLSQTFGSMMGHR